eukprot:9673087-Lingulodinium_polyedra.AAC.1
MYINRQASFAVATSCRRDQALPASTGVQGARPDKMPTRVKAKSFYEVCRFECIAKQKLAGKGENTATKEHHARTRTEWQELPE